MTQPSIMKGYFRNRKSLLLLLLSMHAWQIAFATPELPVTTNDKHVVFMKIGDTVSTIKYAALRIPVDIITVIKAIDVLLDRVKQRAAAYSPTERASTYRNYTIHTSNYLQYHATFQHRLDLAKLRLTNIMAMFKPVQELQQQHTQEQQWQRIKTRLHKPRSKRFVFVAIALAAAGIAATAFGALAANEIRQNNQRIKDIATAEQQNIAADQRVAYTQEHLAQLVNDVLPLLETRRIRTLCDDIEQEVSRIGDVFDAAVDGRLSRQALDNINLPATVSILDRQARDLGMRQLASHLSDYLQMETQWLATDKGFDLQLMVPIFASEGALTIYRFAKLPIPLDHGYHLSLHSGDHDVIAINHARTQFRAMSYSALQECRQLGTMYICDRHNFVRKAPKHHQRTAATKDPGMCLFALVTEDYDLAHASCKMDITTASHGLTMIGAKTFATYTDKPQQGTVRCRNSTHGVHRFSLRGLQTIQVPANCYADTAEYRFEPADVAFSRSEDEWSIAYSWPLSRRQLSEDLDTNKLKQLQLRADSILANATAIPLEYAIKAVKDDDHQYHAIPHISMTTISLVMSTVAIIIAGYAIYSRPTAANPVPMTNTTLNLPITAPLQPPNYQKDPTSFNEYLGRA